MKSEVKDLDIYLLVKFIFSKWRNILKFSFVGLVFGCIIAFSLPKEYTTVVRMVPDTPSENANKGIQAAAAMIGFDFNSDNSIGISYNVYPEVIQSNVFLNQFKNLTLPDNQLTLSEYLEHSIKAPWWVNLISIPQKVISIATGVFKEPTTKGSSDIVKSQFLNLTKEDYLFISKLKDRISVNLDTKSGILSIGVTMQDPIVSAHIANELLDKLKLYIINFRTQKAQNTLNVTRSQYEDARNNYYVADSIYASEYDKNIGLITNKAKLKLERLANEKNLSFAVYQQVASKMNSDMIKLQDDTPTVIVIEPASTPVLPASPKKSIIILGMMILSTFAYIAFIVINFIKSCSLK